MRIFNRKEQTERRRNLRNTASKPEVVIWSKIKHGQILGQKFRRQHGVAQYVLDFYCPVLRLAIEIDGESHFREGSEEYDIERQAFIESFGIHFLRFTNADVAKNLDGVLQAIYHTVETLDSKKFVDTDVGL